MTRWLVGFALLLSGAFWPSTSQADDLRPAYIELTQHSAEDWSLLWKASANSRLGRSGAVILPDNCNIIGERERRFSATNILTTISLNCAGPIAGESIGLKELELSSTDALVRIAPMGSNMQTLRLTPDAPIVKIAKQDQITNVASTYTFLGIEHILLGFDHLLFVLALVLLLGGFSTRLVTGEGWNRFNENNSGWLVAKTVTAFTVAHSLTLVGTTLGYLSLPQSPVEAVIALSIVFLVVEIVKANPDELRLSERFPWVIAFLFGLLHGFGFAGALAEIGLPQGDVPLALLTFNLGVEIGQLLIVAAGLIALALIRHFYASLLQPIKTTAAYGIGITATYWFIDRMIA